MTIQTPADWQDFRADGFSDALVLQGSAQVETIFNNTNGTAGGVTQTTFQVAAGWAPVATIDVTGATGQGGPGAADIVYMNASTGDIGFYEGGAATQFGTTSPTWHPLPNTNGFTVVDTRGGNSDFTGDGSDDILLYNNSTREIGFWNVNPTSTNPSGYVNYGTTWHTMGILPAGFEVDGTGDFDDSVSNPLAGKSSHIDDILLRNVGGNGEVGILEMTGQDTTASSHIAQTQWFSMGVVDPTWAIQGVGNFVGAVNSTAANQTGQFDDILWRGTGAATPGSQTNSIVAWDGDSWIPSTVTPVRPNATVMGVLPTNQRIVGTGDYDSTVAAAAYDDILTINTTGSAVATPNTPQLLAYHSVNNGVMALSGAAGTPLANLAANATVVF